MLLLWKSFCSIGSLSISLGFEIVTQSKAMVLGAEYHG
jgi:hypothetical protein